MTFHTVLIGLECPINANILRIYKGMSQIFVFCLLGAFGLATIMANITNNIWRENNI